MFIFFFYNSYIHFIFFFFFFNDTATTEIYTLSLHDALPISDRRRVEAEDRLQDQRGADSLVDCRMGAGEDQRSEEHTSELQSRLHLVCRLLLEKKKKTKTIISPSKKKKK